MNSLNPLVLMVLLSMWTFGYSISLVVSQHSQCNATQCNQDCRIKHRSQSGCCGVAKEDLDISSCICCPFEVYEDQPCTLDAEPYNDYAHDTDEEQCYLHKAEAKEEVAIDAISAIFGEMSTFMWQLFAF